MDELEKGDLLLVDHFVLGYRESVKLSKVIKKDKAWLHDHDYIYVEDIEGKIFKHNQNSFKKVIIELTKEEQKKEIST